MNQQPKEQQGIKDKNKNKNLGDQRQSTEFKEQKREQAGHQPRDEQGRFISSKAQQPTSINKDNNKL